MRPETLDFYGKTLRRDEDGDLVFMDGLFWIWIGRDRHGWCGTLNFRRLSTVIDVRGATPQAVVAAIGGQARELLDALKVVLNAT